MVVVRHCAVDGHVAVHLHHHAQRVKRKEASLHPRPVAASSGVYQRFVEVLRCSHNSPVLRPTNHGKQESTLPGVLNPNELWPVADPTALEDDSKRHADERAPAKHCIAEDERNSIATEQRGKRQADDRASGVPRDVKRIQHHQEQGKPEQHIEAAEADR